MQYYGIKKDTCTMFRLVFTFTKKVLFYFVRQLIVIHARMNTNVNRNIPNPKYDKAGDVRMNAFQIFKIGYRWIVFKCQLYLSRFINCASFISVFFIFLSLMCVDNYLIDQN